MMAQDCSIAPKPDLDRAIGVNESFTLDPQAGVILRKRHLYHWVMRATLADPNGATAAEVERSAVTGAIIPRLLHFGARQLQPDSAERVLRGAWEAFGTTRRGDIHSKRLLQVGHW